MKTNTKSFRRIVCTFAATLLLPFSSMASILLYDGFDYPPARWLAAMAAKDSKPLGRIRAPPRPAPSTRVDRHILTPAATISLRGEGKLSFQRLIQVGFIAHSIPSRQLLEPRRPFGSRSSAVQPECGLRVAAVTALRSYCVMAIPNCWQSEHSEQPTRGACEPIMQATVPPRSRVFLN